MMPRLRLIAPVAAVLLVSFPASHAAPAPPKAPAPRSAPAAQGALTTDRQKLSYAIGMRLGNGLGGVLAPIKDDIDQATVIKALNATVAHGATELTIPEAQAQLQAFGQLMQARQAAAQAKKPAPVHAVSAADKHKLSYAMGMKFGNDLGGMIESHKADADPDIVLRAFNTAMAHGTPELTPAQADAQMQAYDKKVQARQQAEAQAGGQKNLAAGAAFLAANAKKPGVKSTATGLQYMVEKQGTGPKPKPSDSVKVNYSGQLLDGTTFDSSAKHGGPATFRVDGVVPGRTEALQLMNVGSKYVLWVPAKLAYGSDPSGPGGPNSLLKFEVELLSIEK